MPILALILLPLSASAGELIASSRDFGTSPLQVLVDGHELVTVASSAPRVEVADGQHAFKVIGADPKAPICEGRFDMNGLTRLTITPTRCTTSTGGSYPGHVPEGFRSSSGFTLEIPTSTTVEVRGTVETGSSARASDSTSRAPAPTPAPTRAPTAAAKEAPVAAPVAAQGSLTIVGDRFGDDPWVSVDGEPVALVITQKTWTLAAGSHTVEVTSDVVGHDLICAGSVTVAGGQTSHVSLQKGRCIGIH